MAAAATALASSTQRCGDRRQHTSAAAAAARRSIVGTDLPLQGASADTSADTNQMIQLYLDSIGHKAGNFTVKLKTYDDSTAAKGAWDDAACAANAKAHVANTDEVAVMGTFNSGCADIELPTLNQDPSGPMLMVSHANTNPGLTKTWDTGEPGKYYPTGKRNYARVVTTDDYQGQRSRRLRLAGPEGQERLHPQRQPGLRHGRRAGVPDAGAEGRHERPGQRRRGTPARPTTPRCSRRSSRRAPTWSTSPASTTTTVVS